MEEIIVVPMEISDRYENIDTLELNSLEQLLSYCAARKLELLSETETIDDKKRKANDDEFVLPKKTAKASITPATDLTVSNQFDLLSGNEIETDTNKENDNDQSNYSNDQKNTTPIILRNKEKWTSLTNKFNEKKINYTKATSVKDGIRIQPATVADYRAMYQLMKNLNVEFHTHQLKSERNLKVVIKGISTEIPVEDIKMYLEELGYPAINVSRMNGKLGKPIQMALIEIAREYKSIYSIKRVCGLDIDIEPLRSKGTIQCHRCQLYGHVQRNCNAEFRCMKCAENHSTHLCTKPKTTAAKCANCGGAHTSVWKNCSSKPGNADKLKATPTPKVENLKDFPKLKTKTTNVSQESIGNNKTAIATELAHLLIHFSNKKPNETEKLSFNNHIFNILQLLN